MISGINYQLIIIVSALILAIPIVHYRTGNKTQKNNWYYYKLPGLILFFCNYNCPPMALWN